MKRLRSHFRRRTETPTKNAGHGLLHSAMIAANLNNGESANSKLLRFLKDGFYFDSLTTAHYNNQGVFCTDVANTVPGIMMEMCMSSTEDTLEILPAIPSDLSKGSISGLKAKCQVTLDQLDWDLEEGSVVCKLTSDVDQTINFILRDGISSIESDADIENSDLGDIARKINLKANTATELKIRLAEDGERNLALKKTAVASSQSMTSRQQLRLWTEIWEHAGEPARRQTTGFMWTWESPMTSQT